MAYDRLKKLLAEIETDSIKMAKYEKALRDISIKLVFLNAEKDYLASFLDYERLTAINGQKRHDKLMEEACTNFDLDIKQIDNLYELILREIANKGTKKIYKELYNKTYLKEIEEKEKNFEQEATSIKLNMGTLINSNYWRIEGIKNIYNVFQDEVSEKFEKDLSEYRIEEPVEEIPEKIEEIKKDEKDDDRLRNKKFINDDIDDEFEEDMNEYEDDDIDYEENEEESDDEDEYVDFEEDDDFEIEDDEDYNKNEEYDYEDEDEDIESDEDYDSEYDEDIEEDEDYEYDDSTAEDEDNENEEDEKELEDGENEFYNDNLDNEDEFVEDDWDIESFETRLNKIRNRKAQELLKSRKQKEAKNKKEKGNRKKAEEKESIWGNIFKDNKKKNSKKEAKL